MFFDLSWFRQRLPPRRSKSAKIMCTIMARQPTDLSFWNFLYIFLMRLPREVFWFIAITPAVAAPSPKKRHNQVYHYSSATIGSRLLKFSLHLYGIIPECFCTNCDFASGCRPVPQKFISATNGLELLKFSVHIYGFTLGGCWTYCDRVSGCRPAPKADNRKLLNSCMHFIWITNIQKASVYQIKSLRQNKGRPSMFYLKSFDIWKTFTPLAFELGDGRAIGG